MLLLQFYKIENTIRVTFSLQ